MGWELKEVELAHGIGDGIMIQEARTHIQALQDA
jgi:hypothetical protein